ncbi:MAG: SAM-dependent methyltransferase [Polaribacter sp.]|jgi:SAM-dependent methyltransferase
MLIYRFENRNEYEVHLVNQNETLRDRYLDIIKLEEENANQSFTFEAFSITAGKNVKLGVDWAHSNGKHINWRERLICPITNLNNRQRACYHLFLSELHPYADDKVYITEQVSPFYGFLKDRVKWLKGSEYVDSDLPSGHITEADLRHEDFTNLSFEDNSLDKIMSFDCLEHIPNYKAAIAESYRVLKENGRALFSFPFSKGLDETLVRATMSEDGVISHLTEPEYHGDPLSNEGCLSYYTFGWDVLDTFRNIGFNNVYALVYWSDIFGYLGDEKIVFVAQK